MAETAGNSFSHIDKSHSLNGNRNANVAIDVVENGEDVSETTVTASISRKQEQDISSNDSPCNHHTTSNGNDLSDHPVSDDGEDHQSSSRQSSLSLSSKEPASSSMEETVPDTSAAAASIPTHESSSAESASPLVPDTPSSPAAASGATASDLPVPSSSSSGKASKMTTGRKGQSVQSGGRKAQHSHQHHHGQGQQQMSRAPGAPEMPLRIVVNSDMVGAIIGKAGGTIRDITRESKARVDVLRKDAAGSLDKVINIFGGTDCCSRACSKIMEVITEEARNTDKNPEDYPLRLLAHNALIGRVIGKSGATIKRIMEGTGTRVTISPTLFDPAAYNLPERVITIEGKDLIAVIDAESQIFSKLRSSYESDMAMAIAPSFLSYSGPRMGPVGHIMSPPTGSPSRGGHGHAAGHGQPFSPTSVYGGAFLPSPAGIPGLLPQFPFQVPPISPQAAAVQSMMPGDSVRETAVIYIPSSCVGAVIGTGGASIREMMHGSGANIKVAQSPKDQQERTVKEEPDHAAARERRVTVTGPPEAQWKAQMFIFRKVLMDPSTSSTSSSSSEPALRVEIMVPSSQVGRIIGKNGQTVRELQRLTRAQIKLPEPADEGAAPPAPDAETPVSIVGDFFSSQNAQRQIRALVSRGQMSSMMGNPAFELSGMGFQRLRDDHRPVSDSRGSKSKGNKSARQVQKQQSTSSQQSSQEESACDPIVHTKDDSEEKENSDHSSENGNSQVPTDEQVKGTL